MVRRKSFFRNALLSPLFLILLAGCMESTPETGNADQPTRADELARLAIDGIGGEENWSRAKAIQFDFGSTSDGETTIRRRHLWDRSSGQYRIEYEGREDVDLVLLNTNSGAGVAYRKGMEVDTDSIQNELVKAAIHHHLNDIYWLILPLKLFDPGVSRGVGVDSTGREYLTLSFDSVGYTPDDKYRIRIDSETGLIESWEFALQNSPDQWRKFEWTKYKRFPDLGVTLSEAKLNESGNGVVTPVRFVRDEVEPAWFSDTNKMLFAGE